MKRGVLVLIGLLALSSLPALAIQPNEMLSDPQLEARARVIGKDLRCLVCQNESIDDSDADLAHDLRMLVRKRLVAGDSDAQVKQYLVDRYGDYVLLNPPFKASTLVLWLGPLALFGAAAGAGWSFLRRQKTAAAETTISTLTEDEKKRAAALLSDELETKA
jgi:cytochrome c-type biogenesis protein CcmH